MNLRQCIDRFNRLFPNANMTQAKLARIIYPNEKFRTANQRVHRLCINDRVIVSRELIYKICEALHCDEKQLFKL